MKHNKHFYFLPCACADSLFVLSLSPSLLICRIKKCYASCVFLQFARACILYHAVHFCKHVQFPFLPRQTNMQFCNFTKISASVSGKTPMLLYPSISNVAVLVYLSLLRSGSGACANMCLSQLVLPCEICVS